MRYISKIRNVEKTKSAYVVNAFFVVFFLAFDFCRFCVVGFIIPATTANGLRLRRISIPDLIHFLILILEKKPVFSLFNVEC